MIFQFVLFVFITLLIIYFYTKTESFLLETKIPCKKWMGDLKIAPPNICKDCGYPEDCHGPYIGDSWRHIFQTQFLE